MTARAIQRTEPIADSPARAIECPTSLDASSARAKAITASKPCPPARANTQPSSDTGSPARAVGPSTSTLATPARTDLDESLLHLARLLTDIEKARIRNSNRIKAADRRLRPLPQQVALADPLTGMEAIVVAELETLWKQHPLAAWAATIPGCGSKLMGRLIGEIGDPADRQNVAKLWSYCGFNPDRRRVAGMTQTELFKCGSPAAKKAAWKLAYQFMRTPTSPYRQVYLDARERYAGREWTPGHEHQAALRLVAKTFLRDLWVAAREARGLSITPKRGKRGGRKHRA